MNLSALDRRLRSPALMLGLALSVSALGIGNHALWTPDEPRDAAIGLEMWRTGSWWVPRLGGIPFLEKPPLYWWAQSGAFELLGPSTAAARLPSAVFGFASVLLSYALSRRFFSYEI